VNGIDKVYATPYVELGYVHHGRSHWQVVDVSDGRPSPVGAVYPTRTALLMALPEYASFYGATPTEKAA
jgi:hypothetical protein